ncbi:MAG: AAA family ATPase [Calditrichia bacterium]
MLEFLILLIISYLVFRLTRYYYSRPVADLTSSDTPTDPAEKPAAIVSGTPAETLYKLAASLEDFYHQSSFPADFLTQESFNEGVALLQQKDFSLQDLLGYYNGVNVIIACMALEALLKRNDEFDARDVVLRSLNEDSYWKRYFAMKVLDDRVSEPLIGVILSRANSSWADAVPQRILSEFVKSRMEKGEMPTFGNELEKVAEDQVESILANVKLLGESYESNLLVEIERFALTRVDVPFLQSLGRLWFHEEPESDKPLIENRILLEKVQELQRSLTESRARSVVLVGEDGVGKTSTLRVLARKLNHDGWTIFESSASDLLAGQVYIGQLEERIQQLVRKIGGKRKVVWIIPNFHELVWAGTHRYSPTGVLDMIFPFVETGEVLLIGETQPLAYEKLVQSVPRMRVALNVIEISALSQEETLNIAREWVVKRGGKKQQIISDVTMNESFQLTQQYLRDKAAPGNLLQFIDLTWERLSIDEHPREISIDDLLVTLSKLTGLPISILDEREGLDLQSLREFFLKRVMGQPEAVDCLVERVAMIKAGLNDPTRPQGVFLFAGPTGTGKTEIAKTLAEFLFGSSQRMIRLDMSEFKTPDSIDRLLGGADQSQKSEALVNQIRKQPFSVILLDEVEKAYPDVWDLFLQVFDDGRLTDRRGNTADFRHSIIIMTSNLGGVIPRGASIGFTTGNDSFTSNTVSKAIAQAFRKEFLNRIDRVVVFRPLSRAVMREILRKELADVLQRRGLRSRDWAVEWHESAIEYLLDKGFTADLGARPLKRAIERYLLSPLSLTIVNHQFPEGDQFLFVRSNGRKIEVEFIDPDGPDDGTQEPAEVVEATETSLAQIILDPRVQPGIVEFLQGHKDAIGEKLSEDDWVISKDALLSETSNPGFWDDPNRFSRLGLVEYMSRIETGYQTAERLLERLMGGRNDRKIHSPQLLGQLAHQIYLLEEALAGLAAGKANDAFIEVVAGRDPSLQDNQQDDFAERIGNMYARWAEKRRMRHKVLRTRASEDKPYSIMLAVSGYAAYAILDREVGLHVLEVPGKSRSVSRFKVHVRVVAQPEEPAGNESDALLKQALVSFKQLKTEQKLTIVRRYRELPSPLVRDSIRQWRTGRLDRVLDGDFDLIS